MGQSERVARIIGRRGLAWIVGLWSAAALLAGASSYAFQQLSGAEPTVVRAISRPALASSIWIVLSIAIAALTRSLPPIRLEAPVRVHPRAVGLHLAAAVLVTFVLNAAFHAIYPATVESSVPWTTRVLHAGVANLHLNFGAYWIVVIATLLTLKLTTASSTERTSARTPPPAHSITVRSGSEQIRVPVGDIRWIEGAGDYARLHTEGAEHLLSERMKNLERRLDPGRFVRVHRSAIVNVDEVERLRHLGRGDYQATLSDGTTVRVARTRRAKLSRALQARELPERRGDPPGGTLIALVLLLLV